MTRKAFTLIEVMVVIVIITILGGLVLYALRGAGNAGKIQSTRVSLENLKSMLAEYELKTRLTVLPPGGWFANVDPGTLSTPAGADFWHNVVAGSVALINPGMVGDPTDVSPRFTSCATANTLIAMREIAKIPSNAAALAKLPPAQIMKGIGGAAMPNGPLLDAWGNPIIFVPATGLDGVSVGGAAAIVIQAPNNRPFFASAGPDGNFANGDDNLYSFEQ